LALLLLVLLLLSLVVKRVVAGESIRSSGRLDLIFVVSVPVGPVVDGVEYHPAIKHPSAAAVSFSTAVPTAAVVKLVLFDQLVGRGLRDFSLAVFVRHLPVREEHDNEDDSKHDEGGEDGDGRDDAGVYDSAVATADGLPSLEQRSGAVLEADGERVKDAVEVYRLPDAALRAHGRYAVTLRLVLFFERVGGTLVLRAGKRHRH
jgi:hypothetical protein